MKDFKLKSYKNKLKYDILFEQIIKNYDVLFFCLGPKMSIVKTTGEFFFLVQPHEVA